MRSITIKVSNPMTGESLVDETVEIDEEQDATEVFLEVLENNLDIEILEDGKNARGVLH
jgi:hypothetical protein